ncbi:ankyrin repeat-containing protein, partial [Tanacetum coccineum]
DDDSGPEYEVSEESRLFREKQEKAKADFLMKQRAAALAVPTNDKAVRSRLGRLGEPVTLFGEREMDRRDSIVEGEVSDCQGVGYESGGENAKRFKMDCSEIGDDRPLSGCSFSADGNFLATCNKEFCRALKLVSEQDLSHSFFFTRNTVHPKHSSSEVMTNKKVAELDAEFIEYKAEAKASMDALEKKIDDGIEKLDASIKAMKEESDAKFEELKQLILGTSTHVDHVPQTTKVAAKTAPYVPPIRRGYDDIGLELLNSNAESSITIGKNLRPKSWDVEGSNKLDPRTTNDMKGERLKPRTECPIC